MGRYQAVRNDVDAVAVVIEGCLVEQRGAYGVRGVDHGAIRGVAEGVADGGNVVAAPLRRAVALRHLLGNPVSKDGELVGELMINPGNFLSHVGRRIVAALELRAARRLGENAGAQKRLRIGVKQADGNCVAGEWNGGCHLARRVAGTEGLAGSGELRRQIRRKLAGAWRMRGHAGA